MPLLRDRRFRAQALWALGGGTIQALALGVVQAAGAPSLGNTPMFAAQGLINATFKDALSFGAFISMAVPLFAGAGLAARGKAARAASTAIVVSRWDSFLSADRRVR